MEDVVLQKCRNYLKSIDGKLNYITPQELSKLISRGEDFFLLDNRTPEAFRAGHIKGAVNIWLKDVLDKENLDRIPRDKKIVVCCWVGHTASQLMTVLRILGFDAVGLKYGMGEPAVKGETKKGWEELQLPIVKQ